MNADKGRQAQRDLQEARNGEVRALKGDGASFSYSLHQLITQHYERKADEAQRDFEAER